ncbi:MAG: carboxymuconolactone decarboxylase family protein [Saprospiraceae bacterium]|nr:carboxymuconolactone decarboxylase family protein [Saprospiraceae bacterium]
MKVLSQLSFVAILFLTCTNLSAQSSEYEKTKAEIIKALGVMPGFVDEVPKQLLPMAWEHFNSSNNPENQIPAKYMELIKLAVSAQIPCQYCVHAHKVNAELAGASEEEMKEAVMHGAWVRHWSTLAQSTTLDLNTFKKEYKGIVEYMMKQAKK